MRLVFALLLGVLAADAPIFSWMDEKGTLHATDRLGDVPEPYHSMYAAKLKDLEERQKHAGPPPAPEPEPARPSTTQPLVIPSTQEEAARREAWKLTMRQWRAELARATLDLQSIDQRIQQARMNPIMALTPQVQERVEEMQDERDRAMKRVLDARNMLLDVLPKKARDEHVPPLWVM